MMSTVTKPPIRDGYRYIANLSVSVNVISKSFPSNFTSDVRKLRFS